MSTPTGAQALTSRCAASFAAYQGGDRGALDQLVQDLSPLLWQVVRAQGADRQTAEDVVQVAWLTLLRKAETVRDPQAVVAWMLTTARREAWRAVRKTALPRHVDDPEPAMAIIPAPLDDRPDVRVELTEQQRLLWDHLHRLSDRCRQLLRVVAVVDRPDYSEISDVLGIPKGSVGPTRGRCLAKLRQALQNDPAWEGLADGR
jgi:RNA polymerase sigma factor (sigma-70 family)